MKYEKLIRIAANKTVWPDNKIEQFEAYETKAADEAFNELITWYKNSEKDKNITEEKYRNIIEEYKEYKKQTDNINKDNNKRIQAFEKVVDDLKEKYKMISDEAFKYRTELESAKNQLLNLNSTFSAMTNTINSTNEKINTITLERDELLKKIEKLESEKTNNINTINELAGKLEKTENQLISAENTITKVKDYVNFYK